jgi:hypothetical protein
MAMNIYLILWIVWHCLGICLTWSIADPTPGTKKDALIDILFAVFWPLSIAIAIFFSIWLWIKKKIKK